VSGTFTAAGGLSSNAVASWNGSSWQALGGLNGQRVVSLVWHDGFLLAGRGTTEPFFNLARWDGSQWQEDGPSSWFSPFSELFYTLLSSGSKLRLAGGGASGMIVAEYVPASQTWSPLAQSFSGDGSSFAHAIVSTAGGLVVGGGFDRITYQPPAGGTVVKHQRGVSRWSGTDWTPLTQQLNGPLTAITTVPGATYVAGDFTTIGGQLCRRIARWDGNTWSPLGTGLDFEVTSIVAQGGEVYAGGLSRDPAISYTSLRIARWNGAAWHDMPGLSGAGIDQLIWHNGSLHAAGHFSAPGNSAISGVARWDGAVWQPLAEGLDGEVFALVVHQGALVAGGDIRIRVGSSLVACGNLAVWQGSAWQPQGANFNQAVYSLCVHEGQLVAGGQFTSNSGQPLSYIGRWNGSNSNIICW
jgi:hypothetical protein